jgi:hypothetical protein
MIKQLPEVSTPQFSALRLLGAYSVTVGPD